LQEAIAWQEEEKWPDAIRAVRRAKGALAGAGASASLHEEIRERERDLEMARRLQEARLQSAPLKKAGWDWNAVHNAYATAFVWYGLDVDHLNPQEAAEWIRKRTIRRQLVAALEDWAVQRGRLGVTGQRHLTAVCRVCDPDPWHDQFRDIIDRKDNDAVAKVAASTLDGELPPTTLTLLARMICEMPPVAKTAALERVVVLLRQAQERHPSDFWVNQALAECYYSSQPRQLAEAIRFYSIAVALRPECPTVRVNLGLVLRDAGRVVEAIVEYRTALRLDAGCFLARNNLGNALREKGLLEEAIVEFRKAIAIAPPTCAFVHDNLGMVLGLKGEVEEATACFLKAIELDPRYASAHYNLGKVLADKGRADEAIARYQRAIECDPGFARAHYNLGGILLGRVELDEAIAAFRQAVQFEKDFAEAHCNLGHALEQRGLFREAAEAFRRGHELGHNRPGWSYRSAAWLRKAEQLAQLEDRLPVVLAGKDKPRDTAEFLGFAQVCQLAQKRYWAATRFYTAAFAGQPELVANPQSGPRYDGACAAALAGCGLGRDAADLAEPERGRLRHQALDWLRADLAAWQKLLETNAGKTSPVIVHKMQNWQRDKDFAGVRDPEALDRLPEAERRLWRRLWADAADLLARAQKNAAPERVPGAK
jgi:tetratricopeptide (TPR) repeat protein